MCAICNFKIEFDLGHPQALTVAVATRGAIEAGTVTSKSFDGALGNMKLRVAAIDTLKDFQDRLEEVAEPQELLSLPDFYVLLVESGTWGFFHATESGFDPDIVPDAPNVTAEEQADRDVVFVVAQATMRGLLCGRLAIDRAFSDDLLVLDAAPEHGKLLRSLMSKAFPEESAALAVTSHALPNFA
jgi:hypothetical protein